MRKLLKFIFIIGPCFFFFCSNTKALENTYYYSGLNISTNGLFTDNSSPTSIGFSIGYNLHQTNFSSNNYLAVSPSLNLSNRIGNYGISLTQCDMSFISGSYYSVTYYFEHTLSAYPYWTYSKVNYHLGISNSVSNIKRNFNPTNSTTDVQTIYAPTGADGTGLLSSFTMIFKAPENGTCLTMSFSASDINVPISTYAFVGYQYKSLGSNAPSSSDIKNELESSFDKINTNINNITNNIMTGINTSINSVNDNINNSTNEINNNINNATNSINNAIDIMKDSIDNSINSDDEDTSSGKCGIVCKLKGIWNGIVNLPQNIWNFLKVGFDAITNSITSLFEGITNIFTPKEECDVSKNLFDFKKPYDTRASTSSNILTFNLLDNGFRLSNSNTSSFKKVIAYELGSVSSLDGKTLTLSANTNGNGHLQIGYSYYNNGWVYLYDASNQYKNSHTLTIDSNKTSGKGSVYLYFFVENDSSVEFTDIMVAESSSVLPYEEFGKETCTGGGSFFDWFGNFFKSIVSGILELPSKLVTLLIDALKSLFVPTQEHLMDILEESQKLTENFGFVGESMNFFLNIFTSLLGLVNQNGCVNLPEFTIGATSLFESHTFWQAQNVCLSDNTILSSNIETIRTITSIALVCLFINFAARKFFSILSKNDNEVTSGMAASTRGEI